MKTISKFKLKKLAQIKNQFEEESYIKDELK